MTGETATDEKRLSDRERRRRARVVLTGVFAGALLLVALGPLTAPAAAQANNSTAGYYNNTTPSVDNQTWLSGMENATLDDQVTMLTRLSTIVVGSGPTTQGGGGPAGVLVFGFVMMGSAVAMLARSNVGSVGGGTLFVAIAGGIVLLGYAPGWMWAVILLGVGAILTAAYLRSV